MDNIAMPSFILPWYYQKPQGTEESCPEMVTRIGLLGEGIKTATDKN